MLVSPDCSTFWKSYNSFDSWVRFVDAYGGNDLQYLNPKGIIPPTAVIKKGEKRDNPFKEKRRFDATSFPLVKGGHLDVDKPDYDSDEKESTLDRKQLADMEG